MQNDNPLYQINPNPKQVTWEEARRLLKHITTAWQPREDSPAEIEATLQKRARQLARPPQAGITEDIRRVLIFTLGGERYAVPVENVRIINLVEAVVPVPCTPKFYTGVVNVRGSVVSVLDLRLLFNIAHEDSDTPPRHMVLVRALGLEISLLAHHVSGVQDIPADELNPPTEALIGINPDYIQGTTGDGIILLDIHTLFSDSRLIVDEEAL